MNRRERGAQGETLALEFLLAQGYQLLARNYRAERCEIDLILRDGEVLVFAEVKARATKTYGLGREAVTAAKQRNIIRAAEHYLGEIEGFGLPARFDVLEVDLASGAVAHIKDAFSL